MSDHLAIDNNAYWASVRKPALAIFLALPADQQADKVLSALQHGPLLRQGVTLARIGELMGLPWDVVRAAIQNLTARRLVKVTVEGEYVASVDSKPKRCSDPQRFNPAFS